MNKVVALKPRLTEKAYALSEERNTYVFDVPPEANKHDVARAVAGQYKVKVSSVRLANAAGKNVRSIRRKGRSIRRFQRSDIRKAYVTLAGDDKLPLFASAEESEKPAKKEKK